MSNAKLKIFVVGHSLGYATPFLKALDAELHDDPETCDIMWFTGGEDVDPNLYGEKPHPRSYWSTSRSYQEDQLIKLYPEKFKVGTCRGHQQFNVAVGGKLIQHTDRHAGRDHKVRDIRTGEEFWVNSAHHQAIIPHKCEILLVTPETVATTQEVASGKLDVFQDEVEAAYWPDINAFGIQWHPEWMDGNERAVEWFITQIQKYLSQN